MIVKINQVNGDETVRIGREAPHPPFAAINLHTPLVARSSYRVMALHINPELPEYIPLHHLLGRDLETADSQHLLVLQEVRAAIDEVSQQGKAYIDFVLSDKNTTAVQVNQDTLDTLLTALRQHIITKHELEWWKKSAHNTRAKLRQRWNNEPEVLVDTLEQLRDFGPRQLFADEIAADYAEERNLRKQESTIDQLVSSNATYLQLRNLVYILQDPSNPLPTDTDEDDLAVAGGKISLRDPLSLDYYVDPYKSRKCLHVFSKATIDEYLAGVSARQAKNCPVDGCAATITANDLAPDPIMDLRMKVYRQRGREQRLNVERI